MQSSTWPAVGTSSSGVLVTLNAPLLCAVIEGSSTCGCMHHSTRTGLFAGVKGSVTPRPLAALLAARCAVVGLSGGSITSSSSRLWMGAPYICGASVSFVLICAGSHSRGLAACNGGTAVSVASPPVDRLAPAMARYAMDWPGSALRFMAWCIDAGTFPPKLGWPFSRLNSTAARRLVFSKRPEIGLRPGAVLGCVVERLCRITGLCRARREGRKERDGTASTPDDQSTGVHTGRDPKVRPQRPHGR